MSWHWRRYDRIRIHWSMGPQREQRPHGARCGRTVSRFFCAALSASVLAIHAVAGQGVTQRPATLARLDGRVSTTLRAKVTALVDSAVAVGLPGEPLVDKALEGASKGADDSRILTAVRAVATALGKARHALGNASADELAAGASALRAGVSPGSLAGVRRALPGRSLVVPLSVLDALVVQGAPVATATAAVVAYAKRHDDSHMLDFGRAVASALAAGVAPEAAVAMAATPSSPASAPSGGVLLAPGVAGQGRPPVPSPASATPKPKP